MSYDVYTECAHCGQSFHDRNYTSNMSGAWQEAGALIHEWDGKLASECEPQLAAAIAVIEKDPMAFKKFEPDNGWGHVDTMLKFLRDLLNDFRENPTAKVRVSR